jgi:hypothetical protein
VRYMLRNAFLTSPALWCYRVLRFELLLRSDMSAEAVIS